jgi:hypothetical protein
MQSYKRNAKNVLSIRPEMIKGITQAQANILEVKKTLWRELCM